MSRMLSKSIVSVFLSQLILFFSVSLITAQSTAPVGKPTFGPHLEHTLIAQLPRIEHRHNITVPDKAGLPIAPITSQTNIVSENLSDAHCPVTTPRCTTPRCGCRQRSSANQIDTICHQMARLLVQSGQPSDSNTQKQQQTIESSFQLIVQLVEANASAKIAQLEAAYQIETSKLRTEVAMLTRQAHTVDQFRQWMGPIYTNQNRNFQQMQLVAANNASLNRTLAVLEKQLDRPVSPKKTAPHINRNRYEKRTGQASNLQTPLPFRLTPQLILTRNAQVETLKSEIQLLQRRLDSLQPQTVRSTGYLEPLYEPVQPLQPLPRNRN